MFYPCQPLEERFLNAVYHGNDKAVSAFIDAGVGINTRDIHGSTEHLMIAATKAYPDITEILINYLNQHNAKVDAGIYSPFSQTQTRIDIQTFLQIEDLGGRTALTLARDKFYSSAKSQEDFYESYTNAEQLFAESTKIERYKWNFYKFQVCCIGI